MVHDLLAAFTSSYWECELNTSPAYASFSACFEENRQTEKDFVRNQQNSRHIAKKT
jgi:hypothetical protein